MKRTHSVSSPTEPSSSSLTTKKRRSQHDNSELRQAVQKEADLSEILKLIKHKNVNLKFVKSKCLVPLFNRAVKGGNVKLADIILNKKPEILKECHTKELLFYTVDNDDIEMTAFLIKTGANLNVCNYWGMSLLHVLVANTDCRKHNLASLAIKYGAEVNVLDANRETSVLHEAIQSRCPDLIQDLINAGAEPMVQNFKGQTVLFCVAQSPDAAYLLPSFIEGSGKNIIPKYKMERKAADALCYLTKMGAHTIPAMKVILNMGLNVNQTNKSLASPLNCAIKLDKINKVRLLLRFGADPNKRDYVHGKPLCTAASLKSSKITALLIAQKACILSCNSDLSLPIHAACKNSSLDNIRLLLRYGANMNVINRKGLTPFSMMKNPADTPSGRLVIKHFALLTLNGEDIHEMDLLAINSDPKVENIYKKSLQELVEMCKVEVCDGIKYDVFFRKTLKELSVLARNKVFVENFYQSYKLFPMVFPEMRFEMDMAIKRRNILLDKEQMLIDVFEGILPRVFLRSLAEYISQSDLNYFDENSQLLLV